MGRIQGHQVTRRCGAIRFNGCFRSEMRDYAIVPGIAILVTENNQVIRHRCVRRGLFQFFAEFFGFAGRSIGEVNVIKVRSPASAGRCDWRWTLSESERRKTDREQDLNCEFHRVARRLSPDIEAVNANLLQCVAYAENLRDR